MSEETIVSDDQKDLDSVEKKDAVAYETYKRLVAQRKADQEKLKAQEERLKKLDEIEAEKQRLEEDKLKTDGNWKALLESREEKLKTLEEELNQTKSKVEQYNTQFVEAAKLQALTDALGGTLKHPSYFNLVDTDKILTNPETGEIDGESVKKYASSFLQEHKELIAFSKPKMPDGAPKPTGTLSYDEWTQLAKTNPAEARKRIAEVK